MSESKKRRKASHGAGTVIKLPDGRWQGFITLADGSRKRLPPFKPGTSETMARERTAFAAERARNVGLMKPKRTDAPADNTAMGRWLDAWIADRVARKLTATRENRSHYRLHIQPVIAKHIREWSRDDMRALSRALDAKVQSGDLSWKTAINIWGTATKMCDDAAESKHDTIRCRTDNPAQGVRGPDRGAETDKQFLYPSEFLQFVTCEKVPLRWRRVVAVAVYLYPRDGELRVLACHDVDTEHSTVHVTKSLDKRTRDVKSTKSKRSRRVPIEAALLPLLAAMTAERANAGNVIPELPSERDMSRGLRRWLKKAGVTRHELHHKTPTSRPIRFHDMRATGITWRCVRGDSPVMIQQAAGHERFETTQAYVRIANAIGRSFGDVFPRLPAELFERTAEDQSFSVSFGDSVTVENDYGKKRGGRDSNFIFTHESAEIPRNPAMSDVTISRLSEAKCVISSPRTMLNERCYRRAADAALAAWLRVAADSLAAPFAPN